MWTSKHCYAIEIQIRLRDLILLWLRETLVVWDWKGREFSFHMRSQYKGMTVWFWGNMRDYKSSNGMDSIGLSVVEESLFNFIPSYREVLTRSQLPIYVGGELLG
jgi:hypothetical protein